MRLISAMVFCVAALIWASSAQARPWRFDDFSAVTFLGDLQLSPDGTRALVNVTKIDLWHIGFDQRETVVNMASGSIKPLFCNQLFTSIMRAGRPMGEPLRSCRVRTATNWTS